MRQVPREAPHAPWWMGMSGHVTEVTSPAMWKCWVGTNSPGLPPACSWHLSLAVPSHFWAPVGKMCQPEPIHHGAFVQNQSTNVLHLTLLGHSQIITDSLASPSKAMGRLPGEDVSSGDRCRCDEPQKLRHDSHVFRRTPSPPSPPPPPLPHPLSLPLHTRTHFRGALVA